MKTVNVHEAKTHLSRLLERVEAGEEVVIARSGHPIARLIPFGNPRRESILGIYRGQVWISDDFDAPLPDDILAAFEGTSSD